MPAALRPALFLLLVAAGGCGGPTTRTQFAGAITLRIVNRMPSRVARLYIVPMGTRGWGDEWLAGRAIPQGGIRNLHISPGTYRVRMITDRARGELEDQDLGIWRDVDLHTAQEIDVGDPDVHPLGGGSSVASTAGGDDAPDTAQPEGFLLTLRNDCAHAVAIFQGEGEPTGDGTRITLAPGEDRDFAGSTSEHIWILDASGAPVTALSPAGTQSMTVLASCTGFGPP